MVSRDTAMGLFSAAYTPYKGQDFAKLKKAAIESGHPFIDPEFPPDEKALFLQGGKAAGIDWKRPKDFCDNPKLFVDGVSGNDLNQGAVGNCWFVAACSCLAYDKEIWTKVIPEHNEQEWDDEHPEKYGGIFHFRFWRYGEWVDVVVDDFLPTRDGKLVYCHSKSRNEFWSALLEKAYAKTTGCYELLDGGELAEALEDFTGGVSEPLKLDVENYKADEEKRDDLFKTMKKELDYKALMAAAIPAKGKEEMEQTTDTGLVKGHAYGITAVRNVNLEGSAGLLGMFNKEKLPMIRLRNPWGQSEWKGAFSDGSAEWDKIDKASREKIGLTFDDDGEFWMTMEDFCTYFQSMSICRMVNTSFFSLRKKWHEAKFHGEWAAPARAGGCINNKETFLQNPQYRFDITEDESEVLAELTQKAERADGDKHTIGFTIMKVEENRGFRVHKMQEVVKSSAFTNARSVFLRHFLKKGRYTLVPTTFEAGQNGLHLLRVYTGESNSAKELALDKPSPSFFSSICCCFWCCKQPTLVTRIRVLRAVGLEKQDTIGGADPYAIIRCERQEVWTPVANDTLSPEWNTAAIFFRKDPSRKPIKITIWNSNPIRDAYMGKHKFISTNEEDSKIHELNLVGRKKEQNPPRPGKLFVEVTTSRNLHFL